MPDKNLPPRPRKLLDVSRLAANIEGWLRNRLQRRATPRKRLLFIDALLPLPWYGAGYPRANAIVRLLHQHGWRITCFSIEKNKIARRAVRADIPPSIKIIRRGKATKLARSLFGSTTTLKRHLFGRTFAYDVVLVSRHSSIRMVGPVLEWLKATNENCKFIFDFEALPALGERSRKVLGGGETREDAEARVRSQIAETRWFDAVTCNSPEDARQLRRLGRTDAINISYLDAPAATPAGFSDRKNFLFVGRLMEEGSPNVEGLRWFIAEVWPTIVATLGPKVHLLVAGLTSPDIRSLKSETIEFLGVVRDLTSLYAQARVFVAANRVSYGVPLKVIEAAAYGVPIVTTDEINVYLGWRNGADIMCSDDPSLFAKACIELYEQPDLWQRIRAGALATIDPKGDQRKLLDLFDRVATAP